MKQAPLSLITLAERIVFETLERKPILDDLSVMELEQLIQSCRAHDWATSTRFLNALIGVED